MLSLEQFLAAQQSNNTVNELKTALEADVQEYKDFLGDKRWKPSFPNSSGSVDYIIRFLPSKSGNPKESLFTSYKHSFKGDTDQYLIENCPTTIGKECPVCADNKRQWNQDNDKIRPRSRKNTFYANVLVIKDPINPENEGKVLVYEMPKTIKAFIDSAVNPEFDSDVAFDPFNIFTGANFHIKAVKNVYWKYDRSCFMSQSSVFDHTQMKPEELLAELYDIASIGTVMPFKNKEELQKRLDIVDGKDSNYTPTTSNVSMNPNRIDTNNISTNQITMEAPVPVVEAPKNEVVQEEKKDPVLEDIGAFLKEREFPDF